MITLCKEDSRLIYHLEEEKGKHENAGPRSFEKGTGPLRTFVTLSEWFV